MALPALSPPFTSRYFPVSCAAGRYTSKLKLFGCLLNPSHEKQNDKDDQDDADESDATLEDCGNLIRQNPTANLHLSGSGVAMPMVACVALGATMATEQKRGG